MGAVRMEFPNGKTIIDHLKWWNLYEMMAISMIPRFKRIFCDEVMVNATYSDMEIYNIVKDTDQDSTSLSYQKDKLYSIINPAQYTVLFIGSCT